MITTQELSKNFGKTEAVAGLFWHVPEGSISGLLGHNGAGKSTTLRMLLGMVRPTAGAATVNGLDIRRESVEIRQFTAYVPDRKSVYGDIRVADFLRFYGGFFPDWISERAVRQLDRWQVPLTKRMRKLSKGMQSKVLLSAVFARDPKLVLLDEPTEGLDPQSVEEVLSFLAGWAAEGERTIVICSHRLDEIERVCDRVSFIQSGRIALSGELGSLQGGCKVIDVGGAVPADTVRQWSEVQSAMTMGSTLRIVTRERPTEVIERLGQFHPSSLDIHDLNLREIYLAFCAQPSEVTA